MKGPGMSRRALLASGTGGAAFALIADGAVGAPAGGTVGPGTALVDLDPIRTELVMNLVVTCGDPEPLAPGGGGASKDGDRTEIWPIVGGRFSGPGISGAVVRGGGDFPVTRPDGVEVIDALYRLRTGDGVTILIHNRGLAYPAPGKDQWPRYRLVPEFTAPVGRYDWLNRSIFLATLTEVPPALALAGPGENDRLIQVHRVL